MIFDVKRLLSEYAGKLGSHKLWEKTNDQSSNDIQLKRHSPIKGVLKIIQSIYGALSPLLLLVQFSISLSLRSSKPFKRFA